MRAVVTLIFFLQLIVLGAQPEDIFISNFSSGYSELIDLAIDETGYLYAAEKGGKIYRIDSTGSRPAEAWLDLSEEVTNWNDHGLLAICLDKNFLTNGFIYTLYTVDPYWEAFYGQPSYNPDSTIKVVPTWGRLTRFQADVDNDFSVDITASRRVILGETVADGIPLHHKFHGLGKLVMADDSTLLLSVGDGAENNTDIGDNEEGTLVREAIELGILPPEHHIGCYRAQYLGSLQGKILRIDPVSGEGLSSNPWFDPMAPKAAQSRIWALGLRNPYRFYLLPNTGSHYPEDGQPGTLVIGDVGNGSWEELNICTEGGQNFGWPIYEGQSLNWSFSQKPTPENPLAPNPLFGEGNCRQEFFDFRQTIRELRGFDPGPPTNPCDENQIVDYFGLTSITTPVLAWSNQRWNPPSRATTLWFDSGGNPRSRDLADPLSPVVGENFDGYSALGGFFLDLPTWPEQYQGKLVFYDYSGFIKLMTMDEDLHPSKVEPFHNINGIHTLVQDQYHNRLLFLTLGPSVGQITFGGNPAPVAIPEADRNFGGSELTVNFNAYNSYDPNDELEDLDFRWSFPDGSSADGVEATHTFLAAGSAIQTFQVYLTATDPEGESHTDSLIISLNNSPPEVSISSFDDGDLYPVDRTNLLELRSEVFDAEHARENLSYEWQVYLHHNDHYHPEPLDDNPSSFVFLGPPGCDEEIYFYRVRHRVTDPEGLFTEVEQILRPDCAPAIVPPLEAEADPEGVDLDWQLPGTPLDYRKLELQRSNNYFDFVTIAELDLSQTEYRDEAPLLGNNIYRLKVSGSDLVLNYSNLVMVSWPVPYQFTLAPNPSDGRFQLSFNDPFVGGPLDFQLYDQIGRHLKQVRWFEEESDQGFVKNLDISDLPSGVYWYTLEGHNLSLSGRILLR